MTIEEISSYSALAIAGLAAVGQVYKAWKDSLMAKDLQAAIAAHKAEQDAARALQQQQMDNNTARLNGQSAKIDNVMMAMPPPGTPTMPQTMVVNQPGATMEAAPPADADPEATAPNP